MTDQDPETTGRVDDETEVAADSDTTDGPAADGEYDPAQGSPDGSPHPVADDYPDEKKGYDDTSS